MQTFLPFASFGESARVLDNRRLGKQRVENLQILNALVYPSYGWQRHPAVGLWRGHAYALWQYHEAVCDEWTARGFKDTCRAKVRELLAGKRFVSLEMPPIVGCEKFHASHRAALLAKDFTHYKQFGWSETPKIDYIWQRSSSITT